MAQQDQYKESKTIHFPGMVVRVASPILTDDERAIRMKAIHKQAEQLLKKSKHT